MSSAYLTKSSSFADKTRLLLQAVRESDVASASNLLNAGTDPNCDDDFGNTPLIIASDLGDLDIIEELVLRHKCKLNVSDKYGQTALIHAAKNGDVAVVTFLVKHKANVNMHSVYGQTALMKAAYANSTDCVHLLVSNGAHIDYANQQGRTALMVAADNNNLRVVKYLLQAQASPNVQDSDGNSAIMLAARRGNTMIIEYLTSKGVQLDLLNQHQQTLYDVPPLDETVSLELHVKRIHNAVEKGLQKAQELRKIGLSRAPSSMEMLNMFVNAKSG